ncbi:MAG: NYN domain-containing protein [Nitrospirae bacterium]|nr:NYN domain-containing protein [Nitrospirota bacterium]
MTRVAFIIDGYFFQKQIIKHRPFYLDGKGIRGYCCKHLRRDEKIYRIFFYDTPPLDMKGHNLVTGKGVDFSKERVAIRQNQLFKSLKETPNVALRLGKTAWNNKEWVLKNERLKSLLKKEITVDDLTEQDVKPNIGQKAVDMKMGLDIALMAIKKLVDKIIVISGDADIVPALKLARQEGLQVGLDPLWNPIQDDLREHVDYLSTKFSPKR